MLGKTKEGIQHYEARQKDWVKGANFFFLKREYFRLTFLYLNSADLVKCHNWWHYGVYHIEKNEFEKAEQIFEENCVPICVQDGNLFNIVDNASFLYRLKLIEDQNPREALWSKIHPRVEPHLNQHTGGGFTDFHLMMSCLGNKRYDQAEQLIETLDKEEPLYALTNTVLNAMYNHERGRR